MLRNRRELIGWLALFLGIAAAPSALAQIDAQHGPIVLTLEGYANLTTGFGDLNPSTDEFADGNLRVDAAVRALARWANPAGPNVGLRVAIETSAEDELDVAEASLLILGRGGRLEIGDRQGLPDVLVGYAPNNFTFTGAEFGPASGPSLDPGGGLQTVFLGRELAAQLRELSVLGFAASLADDRSSKLLYVSPKWRGWLAGVSYAPNATDPRFSDLVQAGLTRDLYWKENVLHVGGSYSFARADDRLLGPRDIRSLNVGATLVVDYDWMFGASFTYDGTSGVPAPISGASPADSAWGCVVSINYNRGPWTIGAFAQRSTREGDEMRPGDDGLSAFEAGLSYRVSTRLRLYGAWYYFDLDDEGGTVATDRHRGQVVLIGLRAAL